MTLKQWSVLRLDSCRNLWRSPLVERFHGLGDEADFKRPALAGAPKNMTLKVAVRDHFFAHCRASLTRHTDGTPLKDRAVNEFFTHILGLDSNYLISGQQSLDFIKRGLDILKSDI